MQGDFGREVVGLDLSLDLDPATREAIDRTLVEHQVLLFRGQHLDDERLLAIGRWLGDVRPLPGGYRNAETVFGVRHLSNLDEHGKPTGRHPDHFSMYWHTDGATLKPPAKATLLYALQSPEVGVATEFASMIHGLAAFSPEERRHLEQLNAVHDVDLARVFRHGRAVNLHRGAGVTQRLQVYLRFLRRMLPGQATVHPVVRRCAVTGRKAIVLGSDAWRIRGMSWRRGMREVDTLTERAVRDGAVLRYPLCAGDLVIWDNRFLLHRATDYDTGKCARVMRQVVIMEPATA